METFEDFNPRTAQVIGWVADELQWSRHDVQSAILDNDPALELPNDHFDKYIDTDLDTWSKEILPIVSYLVDVGYIELPSKRVSDKLVDFATLINAIRDRAATGDH